jgi:hypothetical protein
VDEGNIRLARTDMTVVLDAGNGAGGPLALACMHALGLKPEALYCDMDGRFPNHHPDPTLPKNLEALIARVKETNAAWASPTTATPIARRGRRERRDHLGRQAADRSSPRAARARTRAPRCSAR